MKLKQTTLITSALFTLLAFSGQTFAGKGTQSGYSQGSTKMKQNAFGNTYRYQHQESYKLARQFKNNYRYEKKVSDSGIDRKSDR